MVTVIALAFAGAAALAASPAKAVGDTIVVRWNAAVLDAVRTSSLGPPMVSRALAIVHTCIYDAWAAYDAVAAGTRYGGGLRRPLLERTEANKTKAVSYAAYRAAVDLFPAHKSHLDAFMSSLGYDPAFNPTDATSPAGVGVQACAGVLAYRHYDGSNQLGDLHPGAYSDYTGYSPVNAPRRAADRINPATVADPDKWQPLTYQNRAGVNVTPPYLAPHWSYVQPFALLSSSIHRSLFGPATYGTAAYKSQADELLAISANLTDQQKAIAEYWADGPSSNTPPGHWCLVAAFVSRRDSHTIDDDAKMFFAMTNAVMDAGIAAWDDKRAFNSVRPITAVCYLYEGRPVTAWRGPGLGTGTIDGGTWRPYQPTWFPTPPFPEYLSGHSAFSAAAAEILKSFTGSDRFGSGTTIAAGSSTVEPGIVPSGDVTLTWPTFSAAAAEAGMSRRYGGIHFAQGDLDGRSLGRLVGTGAWLKAQRYFLGLA
ncbi:MAG TPA: vanadium-dependent haloperoxidase [Planosporangium sp.]|nr:vanadium-dependent haloperoxidase [Planosporangium sp.]